MQIGDIVKYRNQRPGWPPIKGVWLVIDVSPDGEFLEWDRGDPGNMLILKKGERRRACHSSHLVKV